MLALPLGAAACREESSGLRIPSLQITTTTVGVELDPDGYTYSLDGGAAQSIGLGATVAVEDLPDGDHTIELGGLAPNCHVVGTNPSTVTVVAGVTAITTFDVTCGQSVGSIALTVETAGASPDPDGYELSIDDATPQAIAVNASVTLSGLAAGVHSLTLSGLAPNCILEGDNPRRVAVIPSQTVILALRVDCSPTPITQWLPMASTTDRQLTGVWGSSPSDVFAVGESLEEIESGILHYDGQAWSQQVGRADLVLRAVWGSAANDVYAVGAWFDVGEGAILHYDGMRWERETGPSFGSNDPPPLVFFSSVAGSSATDVFVVGTVSTDFFKEDAVIAHYDGTTWSLMPVSDPDFLILSDVSASSDHEVYAVGTIHIPDEERFAAVVLRYDGAEWRRVLEEDDVELHAVWAGPNGEAFAVGAEGAIWHYDGTSWSAMTNPSSDNLFEVWGSSVTDVFAVGDRGTILHYDGAGWSATNPTDKQLFDVWGSSPFEVFAVGDEGTILRGIP